MAGPRELAAGRADLLAEVAGIMEGFHEGELQESLARQAAQLCRDAEADPAQIRPGSTSGAGVPLRPASRRSPVASTAR